MEYQYQDRAGQIAELYHALFLVEQDLFNSMSPGILAFSTLPSTIATIAKCKKRKISRKEKDILQFLNESEPEIQRLDHIILQTQLDHTRQVCDLYAKVQDMFYETSILLRKG